MHGTHLSQVIKSQNKIIYTVVNILNINYTKKISQISMYYVETRADNSGYTNHRVTCFVVMGSPFDSEQVC
jgi:hypothetical protein